MPVSFLSHRTLLALGCHVGMGDEKAEENLKKIKLPKTYDNKDISFVQYLFIYNFCIPESDIVCPLAM